MPSIFCQQCGTKHNYESSKPNFCTNCGNPFGSASASVQKQEFRAQKAEDPPTPVETNFLNIQKLDFEIINNNHSEVNLGSVMQEQKLGLPPRTAKHRNPEDSVKEIMDLCKPAKDSIDIEESK